MPDKIALSTLDRKILACKLCPRLRAHCAQIARDKRAAYKDWKYHGRPVPNFLPPSGYSSQVRLLVVGLAPGADGANRTGRMFTGDRSGDFLYGVMHQAGLASQPQSTDADDGLVLTQTVITAPCHCAPPDNKPSAEELSNCAPWLEKTFDLLPDLKAVICLGRMAFDSVLRIYQKRAWIEKKSGMKFAHGAAFLLPPGSKSGADTTAPAILCSYHPSQQNTFTGRLTSEMLLKVFKRAGRLMAK